MRPALNAAQYASHCSKTLQTKLAAVRAALRIDAGIGHSQTFDGLAAHQMLSHNLLGVFRLHAAVPHSFGIHHDRGSVLALVQATGLVDAHKACKSRGLCRLLQCDMHFIASAVCARGARRTIRTGICTDKDMMFEDWQFVRSSCIQTNGSLSFARLSTIRRTRPARICENEGLDLMSTDNLLSLKDDMVAFIEGHGIRRLPGYVTEDIPSILWESNNNPDAWKDFVEMAKHVGAPFITFSEMTLDGEELDSLIEEAREMNFPDEEASELVEAEWLRKYAGKVGYLQLGFIYQGVAFLHETTTEWYERFQALLEDIDHFHDIVIDEHDHDHDDEDE